MEGDIRSNSSDDISDVSVNDTASVNKQILKQKTQ